jgi:hypothetical protein
MANCVFFGFDCFFLQKKFFNIGGGHETSFLIIELLFSVSIHLWIHLLLFFLPSFFPFGDKDLNHFFEFDFLLFTLFLIRNSLLAFHLYESIGYISKLFNIFFCIQFGKLKRENRFFLFVLAFYIFN